MVQVQQITNDPNQKQAFALPDGSIVTVEMSYKPQQYAWVITNLTWKTFQITNLQMVNSLNLLQQFKNIITFGIAISTTDGFDPTNLNDFQSGYATMYFLDVNDIAAVTAIINE